MRIYNGELFQGRRCCALPVPAIHQGDRCHFTYHSERRAVSLRVNNSNQGVIFDNVSATGLRPCVLFQRSTHRKTVSVSDVSFMHYKTTTNSNSNTSNSSGNDKTKLSLTDAPTLSTVMNASSVLSLLLSAVEELAIAKREELTSTSHAALVHAYCAEASVEVILLLIALVQKLHSPLDAHHGMVHSLLVVLDLQFQCIKLSKIDLRDLGFHKELQNSVDKASSDHDSEMNFETLAASYTNTGRFTDPVVTRRALQTASVVLQDLMSCPHAALSGAAVVAFSHGLSFFLPSTERKLSLVADILRDLDVTDIKQILHAPRLKLLQLLVQRFRDTGEILGFIDFVASNFQHAESLAALMTVFLELLISLQSDGAGLKDSDKSTSDLMKETEFGTAQKTAFVNDLTALVSTYQQQLVYEILSTGPHPISATYSGEALKKRQQQLCQDLLVPYLRALLGASRKFLLLTMGADISQESRRDAILRDSVVGVLMHPLLYSLCMPGFELTFYQEICPDLVKLLELLTQYSAASTACATASSLILSTVNRAGGASATGQSGLGWRILKACFEDGEGTFTSTEGNTIFTSTTPSNTSMAASA
ncbi:MAG: hypothetical protein B7Z03_15265 [Hydrogenophilales bacterium 32-62-9]|nr:MAG: hypothetical protein B7Z03_15265 [Hydrogenophilales bacterium 32-62-9]